MALLEDAFSIGGATDGDARVKDLQLTGWSNNPNSMQQGRLYYKVTTGDVLQLAKDEGFDAADLVCSGAIGADDKVTLNENNSSGISGSALVSHTDATESTGNIIVTYAQESDMQLWEQCVTDHLDENGEFNGEPRFEQILKRAKIYLDKQLFNKLQPWFRRRGNREIDMTAIAKPRQLAESHALYAMFLLLTAVNTGDTDISDMANNYKKLSGEQMDITQIAMDEENDDIINAHIPSTGSRLTR